jgi:hypothetical protein
MTAAVLFKDLNDMTIGKFFHLVDIFVSGVMFAKIRSKASATVDPRLSLGACAKAYILKMGNCCQDKATTDVIMG